MKKGLIFLLCAILLAAAAAGGIGLFTWQRVTENTMPRPTVRVMEQDLACKTYEWHTPVFGGLLYKDFAGDTANQYDLGEIVMVDGGVKFTIEPPSGFETTVVHRQGQGIDDSAVAVPNDMTWPLFVEGRHQFDFTCTKPQAEKEGYGTFTYSVSFVATPPPEPEAPELPAAPTMTAGNTSLQQGDVLSVRLYALPEGVVPTAETDLGMAVFTPCQDAGGWFCAVPVGNTRAVGNYDVKIYAGEDHFWNIPVKVEAFSFVEQDLTIDVTDPVISEANSPAAYQQYREKIPPLFNTWDEERYWQGPFIQPAEGRISTEFGTTRYTNGDYQNPSVHWGMDIANAEGTPIVAPGAGRVVLAENLLNTGNTIVIEHGGGLKSYYFHMVQLDVAGGDMVEQGQQIGAIGTTGYSTGPHLHFEMRIGNQAINPQMLFDPAAGLYTAEAALPLDE